MSDPSTDYAAHDAALANKTARGPMTATEIERSTAPAKSKLIRPLDEIARMMRIGFPVQVVFRDGRTFNGSCVQAGVIVGGPFGDSRGLVNVRVLTDANPGEAPDLPLYRSIPHVAASGPEDAVVWRLVDDNDLGGWEGNVNVPATDGPQLQKQAE